LVAQTFGTGFLELVVITLIGGELLIEEVDDLITHDVQEFSCMTHDHDCVVAFDYILLQPEYGIQVQMICRFIQQ
jgi:hypothetical protein